MNNNIEKTMLTVELTRRLMIGLLLLLPFSGCETLKTAFRGKDPTVPPLTTQAPNTLSLAEITSAINRNSMAIRNMSTENGQIMASGVLIPLQTRLTFERPKRLRIQASVAMSGQELDFGSNDMLFWIWNRRLPEKEMYYCRHDQFPTCPVRNLVPIEPDWIVEAIGIVEFLPTDLHEGPVPTEDGHLAIISRRQTASGQFVKRTVIDAQTAWVLRQEMYSPQNELVALATSSDHRYDKNTGIHYARRVEVKFQGSEGKVILDLGTPTFNTTMPFNSATFQLPNFDGYRSVDICGPEFLHNRSVFATQSEL